MELNVTKTIHAWLDDESWSDASNYSCSRLEAGDYAGPGSWQAACDDAGDLIKLSPNETAATRDWFGEFGAWDDSERAAWTAKEVAALLLQFIAGDWRELVEPEPPTNYAEFEQATQDCGGRLSPESDSDIFTGPWFYDIGT